MADLAKAMILAAGLGRRMQPYTSTIPKPMVPVAGHPLIVYAFKLLQNAQIDTVVVNTHHLPEQVEGYLKSQPFDITISRETELLETGGGILKAFSLLDEEFFTLNSDVICIEKDDQSVLKRMEHAMDSHVMDGLMLLCPLERAVGYDGEGDFSLDSKGRIIACIEGKQTYVYMGVQRLHKRLFANAPHGAFSLSQLYKDELAKGKQGRLFGLVHDGAWLHVGDPEGITLATAYLGKEST